VKNVDNNCPEYIINTLSKMENQSRSFVPRRFVRRRRPKQPKVNPETWKTSVRVRGPLVPPPVTLDTVSSFKRRFVIAATDSLVPITPARIVCSLPGGSSAWPRIRFIKASVWGDPGSDLRVSNIGYDAASFGDSGVSGSVRPCVHFRADQQFTQRWTTGSDATSWFTIGSSMGDMICDVTIQARGATQSCPPQAFKEG